MPSHLAFWSKDVNYTNINTIGSVNVDHHKSNRSFFESIIWGYTFDWNITKIHVLIDIRKYNWTNLNQSENVSTNTGTNVNASF